MAVRHRLSAFLAACCVLLVAACSSPSGPGGPTTAPTGTTAEPTTAQPTTPAPTTTGPCDQQTVLASWDTTRLAEQTVVIPVNETEVSSITDEIEDGAGGVILFGSSAPSNLGSALATLVGHAPGGIAPFVMTDEEGGSVQRMANLVGDVPSARTMAATMTAAQIRQLAKQTATKMRHYGVTMDLAPVLDLDDRPGPNANNPDGSRSFSKKESVAEADGLAFAAGLQDGGVIPVVKHFPGLGGSVGNTDNVAAATLPWSTLEQDGLLPFAAAIRAGVPAVMVANATVPGLSDTTPASLSPDVIMGVLRGQLHFDGLVITDSLSATAIQSAGYDVPHATVAALAAGADMILFTSTSVATQTRHIVQAIVAAVNAGTLSRSRLEDAVNHILSVKKIDLCGR
ncbi:MAG TPA: glycoside hydrolase family 3 N-terminal domain-containing protein [Micromonosporaceae bacterium]